MTVRLTVDTARRRASIDELVMGAGALLPVVKGNGYGFGLVMLAAEAAAMSDTIAVGTVHEARAVAPSMPPHTRIVVLTPLATPSSELPRMAVPTIGNEAHVNALAESGWRGDVSLKLRSSMIRYGATPADLSRIAVAAGKAGLRVSAHMLHLPLLGPDHGFADAVREVEEWLPLLEPSLPLSVSHVPEQALDELRARHPQRNLLLRVGSALWHGDRSFIHLAADVIDVAPVDAGSCVGYRRVVVPSAGTLVMIGAGTAHGVAALPDGRSPFHHARRRLALVEPPHMHTSMAFVPSGEPLPNIGDWVDVQRPLTTTSVDEIVWRD